MNINITVFWYRFQALNNRIVDSLRPQLPYDLPRYDNDNDVPVQ